MLLFFISLLPLGAQTISEDSGTDFPGSWALQFRMPDLISTSPVRNGDVGSISLQRRIADRKALRAGVDIARLNKADYRRYEVTGMQILDRPTPLNELILHAHLLSYTPRYDLNRLYIGGGPLLVFGREQEIHREYQKTTTWWAGGVEGVIGASVMLWPRIRFFTEYKLRFTRKFYTVETSLDYGPDYIHTETYSENRWEAIPRSVIPLVGVAIGFK